MKAVRFYLSAPDGEPMGDELRELRGPDDSVEALIDFMAGPDGEFAQAGLIVDDIHYEAGTEEAGVPE